MSDYDNLKMLQEQLIHVLDERKKLKSESGSAKVSVPSEIGKGEVRRLRREICALMIVIESKCETVFDPKRKKERWE